MSIRDDLRALAYSVRSIPNDFGLRPYTVAVRVGSWNGTNTGRGAESKGYAPITEANGAPPKVRQMSSEELALGGLGKGSITIGPITPDFAGGGTAISTVKPAVDTGQTVTLLITGPEYPSGSLYALKSFGSDHGLRYTMTAEPISDDQ